jgi:hypothetical protein
MRGIMGAVLVAACLLAGCSGDGDRGGDSPLDSMETAGPKTGDLFVYGDVLDDGKPAKDVQLQVMLRPEGGNVAVGESVKLYEVEAKVDDGRYAAWVDPDGIPSAYWPADQDFLNFEVMVMAGGTRVMWNTTVWRLAGKAWRSDHARLGDPALRMDFDVSRETVRTTESDGTTRTEKTPVMAKG